jgi:hypothetical protein
LRRDDDMQRTTAEDPPSVVEVICPHCREDETAEWNMQPWVCSHCGHWFEVEHDCGEDYCSDWPVALNGPPDNKEQERARVEYVRRRIAEGTVWWAP